MLSALYLPLLFPIVSAVWPLPADYSEGNEVVWIDREVHVSYSPAESNSEPHDYGTHDKRSPAPDSASWTDRIVTNAVERTYDTLFRKSYVPYMFHLRNADWEPAPSADAVTVKHIRLQQNATDPDDIMKPGVDSVDESYTLHLSADGQVTITGVSSIGLAYGLTTLTQLFYRHSGGGVYSPYAPVEISDRPLFQWRGLNVDTSRHFFPVEHMLKTIDALAYSKMNRLHWHITDSQSWPLVIDALPELADKGAYVSFAKYTPVDILRIQNYGALHGVSVAMEIDQPGHTTSIGYAYPDLIAAFNVQPNWDSYAAQPPTGTLKLNSTAVYDFLQTMFAELLPRLSPLTSYFHLGGDEVNANAYTLDDTVLSNDSTILQPLMQRFMDRNQAQLREAKFTPLVWEEMLLEWNLTLPRDTIVQTWQSSDAVVKTVEQGYRVLAGNYEYWYLDCGHGQFLDFRQGESAEMYWPYTDYCDPRKNWKLMYSYDPYEGVAEADRHLVVGGEAHSWNEQTDPINFDSKVWPRAAVAGEVLWAGAKDAQGRNRSQIEASPRLVDFRERLVARGVGAEPINYQTCNENGTSCAL